ncbi:MAG: outer-membrane lipoprotein carrier protein LolA [Spirochaetia bacterium]
MSRKAILVTFLLMLVSCLGFAQEMVSAEKFFASLSASFGAVKDYEAVITMTQGKSASHGKISYKTPFFLRIDFDDPKGQVVVFDGETLTFFSPQYEVVLEQKYKKKNAAQIESLASAQGLTLLQRNYSVAYLTGPAPVPLEDGSREMVVKLKLTAHGTTGFSQLIISVKDSLIRRIEGTQVNGDKITMDIANIRVNQGVPDERFKYDPPAYANVISDWLFDPEE